MTVELADLRLDLDNYRIPTHREDEPAALAYLFASEDVLGAARSILRDGYFDNEVPIVTNGGGGYVVLEGNRRVSALKALHDPSLVPNHAEEVRALLRRFAVEAGDLPDAIRVLVADSREQAAPHIARLHTGLSKKRWSVDQQANYYYSLLGPQFTVEDIKSRYPDVNVVRMIKMAVMRRFMAGVRFKDESLRAYVAGEAPKLTMSAFEYAYRNADIAVAIGARFDDDGQLLPRRKKPERIGAAIEEKQRRAAEYLTSEFRAGRLNTRSLDFKKDTSEHAVLVSKLLGASPPDLSPHGGGADDGPDAGEELRHDLTSGDEEPDEGSNDEIDAAGDHDDGEPRGGDVHEGRGPNHPDTRDTLQLGGLDYTTYTSIGLQRRYQELRKISVGTLPVAAAVLLRSVLETTIKYHFEGTSTAAVGELQATMRVVADAYNSQKALRQPISSVQSGAATTPGTVKWFNVVTHSADVVVKAQDVRDAYARIEPILRTLLRPPAAPSN